MFCLLHLHWREILRRGFETGTDLFLALLFLPRGQLVEEAGEVTGILLETGTALAVHGGAGDGECSEEPLAFVGLVLKAVAERLFEPRDAVLAYPVVDDLIGPAVGGAERVNDPPRPAD